MDNTPLTEPSIPAYYVVSRQLPLDHAEFVVTALRITPIAGVVISTMQDSGLAFSISDDVIRVYSDDEAHSLALQLSKQLNQSILVIGEAVLLDAVYEDGKREPVAAVC